MSRHPKPNKRLPRSKRVVVSWLFPQDVDGTFMVSVINMMAYDLYTAGGRILNGGGMIPLLSGPNLSTARNQQVVQFLDNHEADWLLVVDSDMKFAPDSLERLLAEADPVKAPIVGGLCFGKNHIEGSVEYWATMYGFDVKDDSIKTYRYESWPDDTMFPVNATGTAFLLIHRSVLETMREKFADRAPWIWFEEMNNRGYTWGEDTTFCLRAQQCGFPIYVHTGVEIGHVKPETITGDTFRKWKATL